jgi:hypothetical protein
MTGLAHEKFVAELGVLSLVVEHAEDELRLARADLQRVGRAAKAAGLSERQIGVAARRSGPAVHAWLHPKE